jgi:hypothetical protein
LERFALERFAQDRSAKLKSAPERSAFDGSAPDKSAPLFTESPLTSLVDCVVVGDLIVVGVDSAVVTTDLAVVAVDWSVVEVDSTVNELAPHPVSTKAMVEALKIKGITYLNIVNTWCDRSRVAYARSSCPL